MPRNLPNTGLSTLFQAETAKSSQSQLFHLIILKDPKNRISPLYLVDNNFDITYTVDGGAQTFRRFPLKFSGISVSTDGSIDKASITVSNVSREIMSLSEQYEGLANWEVSVITVYEKFLNYTYTYQVDGSPSSAPNPSYDPAAFIRDEYIIDSYTATEQYITFQLNLPVDFEVKVPRRKFTPYSCYWRYKNSETCQYSTQAGTVTTALGVLVRGDVAEGWVNRNLTITQASNTAKVKVTSATLVSASGVNCIQMVLSPVLTFSAGSAVSVSLDDCTKSLDDCTLHNNTLRFGGFPGIPTNARRLLL